MASFELKILTEDPTELKALVDKLCSKQVFATLGERKVGMPAELVAPYYGVADADEAAAQEAFTDRYDEQEEKDREYAFQQSVMRAEAPTNELPAHHNTGTRELQDVPDRDAEGLKRDARIHSDAAEPFKADGTWKRKRNTPDDVYESVYEELAREAHAVGLYKGPLLGQFELEARVVDTEQAAPVPVAPVVEQAAPTPVAPVAEAPAVAPAPVVEAASVTPAPAPAPAPQAAPAPAGLSAQVSASEQRCKDLLTSMIKQVGPTVAVASLRMFGGAHAITVLTPEQREHFCNVAEALIASGATASDGHEKMLEITTLMGLTV